MLKSKKVIYWYRYYSPVLYVFLSVNDFKKIERSECKTCAYPDKIYFFDRSEPGEKRQFLDPDSEKDVSLKSSVPDP